MKKLSISKALIGLFVVLAIGIGLAACEVGEYEDLSERNGFTGKRTFKLETGNEWSYVGTGDYLGAASGTYEVKSQTITFKVTSPTNSQFTKDEVFTGSVNGNTLTIVKGGENWQLTKKSAAGEVFQLEFADDFDFAVFDAE
ncbi:hypothetical protein AGMMS49579_23150 [Spirochaetia bacterium]|nr:hypothetical protein AGMMS49579_23150 [Spirochaetia bacterium]